MAGRAGIWLTAKKLHIGLDKTSPICYNKGIKGKGDNNMEIKYAYEMTRKAEEVRKEIQAKNNALARAFIEDHIMPEIERVAGTGETLYECSLASINDKRVKQACKDIMQNYGYKPSYIDNTLSIYWG